MAPLAICSTIVEGAYEQPTFKKGDAASLQDESLTERLSNRNAFQLAPNWVALTSPRNKQYYYNTATKETRLSKPLAPPKSPIIDGASSNDPAVGSKGGMSEVGNATPVQDKPSASSQEASEDEGVARLCTHQRSNGATTPPEFNVAVSPEETSVDHRVPDDITHPLSNEPDAEPTSAGADSANQTCAIASHDTGSDPPQLDLPRLDESSISINTTVVGDNDDAEFVQSATSRDQFSPAFRLRICKAAGGPPSVCEDIVFGPDLPKFDSTEADQGTINLCFVASNTQENGIYASRETIDQILDRYGLQATPGRLSSCPQMGTYQMIRPLDNGDFVFTCRSATSVNASTFLCYRYRHSDRSIFGLVLDRRERSQVFIDILKTLDLDTGLQLLPAIALAQCGLHNNIRTLTSLENTYYFNKLIDELVYGMAPGSRQSADVAHGVHLISVLFNASYGTVGSLNISMSATLALTRLIRENDREAHFSALLDAIDLETQGHVEAAARAQARIGQRHSIFSSAMQTTIAAQAHESSTKQVEVLSATREATAASTKTLGTMQELLAGTQDLNRKTEEVSRVAAEYGKLVLGITFATFLVGWMSTCAEIFSMTNWAPRFSVIPMMIISIGSMVVFLVKLKAIRTRVKNSEAKDANAEN